MAINFPDSPSNGDTHTAGGKTFTYDSTVGAWSPAPAGATTFIGLTDTPSSFGTASQIPAINSGANALEFVALPSSVTVYATVDLLPLSGNSAGDQAFVTATNRLYIWNGSGWYNIALINTTPSISGVSSSYALAIDGTATTITITATDPEGLPITYSIASDTSGNIATVTQGTGASSNVFTVTPSTNTANAGTFSLTFQASDGVNIATAPASFTLQFTVENSNYTTALITSVGGNNADNNDFVDSSTNSHTITAAGNVTQVSFSPYRHGGYSTYFDGTTGTKLTTPAQFDFSGAFTAEFWFHIQTGKRIEIGTEKDVTPSDYDYFRLGTNGSGYPFFQCRSDSVTVTTATGSTLVNDSAWHHIAGVRDASGNMTLYVDGVSAATATNNGNLGTSETINIGAFDYESTGNDAWGTGYLRDVRVSSNVRYSANFSVPTEALTADSNTTLLTCHLPYIADGSTNGHTITVNGNTKTEPFAPYDHQEYSSSIHGGSIYSGGGNIYAADAADLEPGSSDFCVEFWLRPLATVSNETTLFTKGWSFGNYGSFMVWTGTNTANYMAFGSTGSSWDIANNFDTGWARNDFNWQHLCFSREGSTFKFFKNGKQTATFTSSATFMDASGTFSVLGDSANARLHAEAIISDLRYVVGSAVRTAEFTPPTAPLTAITNTSLLVSGTNAGIIDKSQSIKDFVLTGNVKSSTTQNKFLTTSMYFDGNGDYMRATNNDGLFDLGFNGEPFTIEWWQWWPTIQDTKSLGPQTGGGFGGWNSSTGHQLTLFTYSSAATLFYQWWNGSSRTDYQFNHGGAFTASTWQHIATVFDGTNLSTYVDGSRIGHRTSGNTFGSVSTKYISLGSSPDLQNQPEIYYSDVRITKGLARYSGTSFTVPSEALQG